MVISADQTKGWLHALYVMELLEPMELMEPDCPIIYSAENYSPREVRIEHARIADADANSGDVHTIV